MAKTSVLRVRRQAFDFVAALRVGGSHLFIQLFVAVARLEPHADLRAGERRAVGVFHQPGQSQRRFQFHIEIRGFLRQFFGGRQVASRVADNQQRAARLHLPRLERPGEAERAVGSVLVQRDMPLLGNTATCAPAAGLPSASVTVPFSLCVAEPGELIVSLTEPQNDIRVAAFGRNVAEGMLAVGGDLSRAFADMLETESPFAIRARIAVGLAVTVKIHIDARDRLVVRVEHLAGKLEVCQLEFHGIEFLTAGIGGDVEILHLSLPVTRRGDDDAIFSAGRQRGNFKLSRRVGAGQTLKPRYRCGRSRKRARRSRW